MEESKIKKRNRIAWPQERVLGFTDGVFAFAITLLVLNLINVSTPISNQSLLPLLLKNASTFISFVVTFFIIARFWMSHTRLFAIIKSYDGTIVRLNNTLLFFITTFPFIASVLGTHIGDRDAVIMYAGCFATIGIIQYLIGRHAYNKQLFISDNFNENFLKIFTFCCNIAHGVPQFCWIGIRRKNQNIIVIVLGYIFGKITFIQRDHINIADH